MDSLVSRSSSRPKSFCSCLDSFKAGAFFLVLGGFRAYECAGLLERDRLRFLGLDPKYGGGENPLIPLEGECDISSEG